MIICLFARAFAVFIFNLFMQVCVSKELRQRVLLCQFMRKLSPFSSVQPSPPLEQCPRTKKVIEVLRVREQCVSQVSSWISAAIIAIPLFRVIVYCCCTCYDNNDNTVPSGRAALYILTLYSLLSTYTVLVNPCFAQTVFSSSCLCLSNLYSIPNKLVCEQGLDPHFRAQLESLYTLEMRACLKDVSQMPFCAEACIEFFIIYCSNLLLHS